ncbi:MAG: glycerol-3-phosphate 1-O-acyltransferase PlsY [Gammaproteobacteria bacterium]|jgi:glycerol-3-phosphate acyltransferase PlsY|nr:glycerol-3-phosphate 1-O-acyltransferase PlsY [Gammaproteobacteria bacterium]
MIAIGIRCLLAYLLGSVLGSLIVGRVYGGVDIRTQGSGNAGGTNALRTQGKVFALWVMLIDVGKGVLATSLVAHMPLPLHWVPESLSPGWITALCGALAIAGHVYPVFYGFKGGKGAATYLGALAVIAPLALVPGLVIFVLTLMLTGYVGLSTVLSVWGVAIFLLMRCGPLSSQFAFGLAMAFFILYTHRSNIARLLDGSENQFKRAMLLRKPK